MRLLVTILLLFFSSLPLRAEDRQLVPGTSWSIIPPPGFVLERNPVTMFLHPSKAVVTIMQMPLQPLKLSDLGEVGSVQGTGQNATKLSETAELIVNGRQAFLMKGHMVERNAEMMSVMVIGEASIGMVIGSVPATAIGTVDLAAIETSLKSAEEVLQSMEQRIEALPYRFGDLAGMRVAELLVGSFAVVTDGPSAKFNEDFDQVYALVFAMSGQSYTLDLQRDGEAARQRILQEYPDATILGTTMRDSPKGKVLEVSYSRQPEGAKALLGGTAWFRADGPAMRLMITQYPTGGGSANYDRLAKVRDAIEMK